MAGIIFLAAAFGWLWSGRWQVPLLALANIVVGFILWGTLICYRIFGEPLSFDMMVFADHLHDVRDSVWSLCQPRDAGLFLIDLALIVAFASPRIIEKMARMDARVNQLPRRWAITCFVAPFIIGLLSMEPQGPWWEPFSRSHAVGMMTFSPIVYYPIEGIRHVYRRLFPPHATPEDRATIISYLHAREKQRQQLKFDIPWRNGLSGNVASAAPNVIFLQVESLMGSVWNRRIAGMPIIPNLERIASEGILLPNFHSQAISTSDSDFAALTSLYPRETLIAHFEHYTNIFVSLPKILGNLGYSTFWSNGVRRHLWNTAKMNLSLGFKKSLYLEDFPELPVVGIGLEDKKYLEKMEDVVASLPQPFFAMIMTCTSHHPFNFEEIKKTWNDSQINDSDPQWRAYVNVIHYADEAIGKFITDLKMRGLLENTILVIYGDHQVMSPARREAMMQEYGRLPDADRVIRFMNARSPAIIHAPWLLKPGIIRRFCGQIDLGPSVLQLLGINQPTVFLGESVFTVGGGQVAGKHFIGRAPGFLFGGRNLSGPGYRWAFRESGFSPVSLPESVNQLEEDQEISEMMITRDLCTPESLMGSEQK